MSYRINYGSSHRVKGNNAAKIRLPALTALCFLLFLFLVHTFWPEGWACIDGILAGRRASASVMALDRFAEELHHGEPMTKVFSDFLSSIQP